MATLNMQIGEIRADQAASTEGTAQPTPDPNSPGGASFWRSKRDRLLTLLSLATVITVPGTGLYVLGAVLDVFTLRAVAAVTIGTASVLWFLAYMMLAAWGYSDLRARIRHWLNQRSQPRS